MQSLLRTLRSLGPAKLTVTLAVSVALLGILLWTAYRVALPQIGPLYGGLPSQHGRAGTLQLPYAESAADAGLGYEVFDRGTASGNSAFVENVNRLRALEGELARSIGSIAPIARARVHLVLPETAAADGEAGAPSASVVIATAGPLPLAKTQVDAIQQLVANAVPALQPQAISIVDDKGNLLARGESADDATATADRSETLRLAYEQRLARAIETLLAPSLGSGNVRAQVSADLDFDRLTETAEIYDPDGQVLRASKSLEEVDNGPAASPQDAAETDAASADRAPLSERNEEAADYAVSRTTRTHIRQGGKLQRLSVAVMVNGSSVVGEDGTLQYRPRSSSEMAQIESLVRAAVGIDESRGDRLDVVNLPFAEVESPLPALEAPGLAGFSLPELLRLVEILVLGAIAFAVIFFVVRPLVGQGFGGQAFGSLPASAGGALPHDAQAAGGSADHDETAAASRDGAFSLGGRLAQRPELGPDQGRAANRVGDIVRAHPEAAVTVVRGWLQREV